MNTGSSFMRKPPPLLIRLLLGVMIDGLFRPLVLVLDHLGKGDRPFRGIRRRQIEQQARQSPFQGFSPGEHDVFVAAYIKSGTNWAMQIAHQLLNHGKGEFGHIHDVVPWPLGGSVFFLRGYAVPLSDESAWRASPEQKRVIKTHFNWEDLPYSEAARYIMVIRDPKDVFVSSYFFFGNVFPLPSVATWFKLFCSGEFPMGGSWAANAASYWAQRARPNVLVLSYKSMKRDLPQTVRRIAEFLDIHAGEEVIQAVCEKSSFEYMKLNQRKFEVWKMIPWRSTTRMMRKGVQGGSSELLTPEMQREMDAYFMAELRRLGSDLPYEEFCDVTPRQNDRAKSALTA